MDPVSEMLITIKNGLRIKKNKVEVPYSLFKFAIIRILEEKGLVRDAKKIDKNLVIKLKYDEKEKSAIQNIEVISKSSRRIYVGSSEIPHIRSGFGFVIISTSQGVLDGAKARKLKIGGELICKVW